MANEKVYPKGIRVFKPYEGSPDWKLGVIIVTPKELQQWIADNAQYLTDYQGNPQLKLDLLKGKDGPYVAVNTYKADEKPAETVTPEPSDSLPF